MKNLYAPGTASSDAPAFSWGKAKAEAPTSQRLLLFNEFDRTSSSQTREAVAAAAAGGHCCAGKKRGDGVGREGGGSGSGGVGGGRGRSRRSSPRGSPWLLPVNGNKLAVSSSMAMAGKWLG